jgi:uncharacterized protein YndB with AHSA1/START domain
MNEQPLRSIEVEVEVPGTPEQVWDAIATGPGIAAWFVPAEVDGRVGGAIAYDMGGGLEEGAVVTAWEPPRRFAGAEEWPAADDRPAARLATEFLVEARSGGTCVVRLVSSLFASGGDWEDELESMREGWAMFLDNLRLYLTYFAGERRHALTVGRPAAGSLDEAWAALARPLALDRVAEGDPVAAPEGAPPFAGDVERVLENAAHHRGLTLLLEEPAPGFALVFVNAWRGKVYANVVGYLFGEAGAAAAARDEAAWRSWFDEHFPARAAEAAPTSA